MRSLPCSAVAATLLLVAATAGCNTTPSTSVTYSYDPRFSFSDSKTYAWVKSRSNYGYNALMETNVRFLADRDFQAKGLVLTPDKPALVAWIGYESDYGGYYGNSYDLRVLTINVARAADNELVWQGRALGSIRTDASSGDLKKTVDGMLASFPPK
jgi:hypothetical protein